MGVRDKRLDANALPQFELFKEKNQRIRWLTDEEEVRLMASAPAYLRPLLFVAIHTGLRRGELLDLRWNDVDVVGENIHVRKSKSGKGRYVSIDSDVVRMLSGLKAAWRERLRARVVRQSEANGFVFSAPRGGVMSNLNRVWYPLLERTELQGLHFHDLRHTYGSRLVMLGVPIYTVQKLMGHKKIEMTMRYAHLAPGHLRAAVELLAGDGQKPWSIGSNAVSKGNG
jgi:integrase